MVQLHKLMAAIQLRFSELADKERGATATEYAILVAFIAMVIIVGVTVFGGQLNSWFNNLGNHVSSFKS